MAYRFKLREDLRDGVRRIATEQLDKVLSAPHGKSHRVEWVHETRKALKRIRSLLRAVRDGLGGPGWRDENAALRLIAGKLSALRDRDVVLQTMANLASSDGRELAEAMEWFGRRLAKDGELRAAAPQKAAAATVAKSIHALSDARDRLARVDVDGDLPGVLALGFERCQRSAREALARLDVDPTEENLHELRKCVQTYQRQHALAQAVWPEVQAVRIMTARSCAQMLGQAQDLSVLSGMVKAHRSRARRDREFADRILEACRGRQAHLREAVLPAVARLLAVKPKAAAEELVTCWHAAVAMSSAKIEHPGAQTEEERNRRDAA